MPDKLVSPPQPHKPATAALQINFNQGVALHRQGKLADAGRIYREVLRSQPNHFDALHLLGLIALQTQHTEWAVELIRKAIRLNPKIAAAHNNLGRALHDLDHPLEALASFDNAIALRPDLAEAYDNRGHVLENLGRYHEALANYDKAIALRPDLAAMHNNRGNVLNRLNRYEEALASYDRALALNPDLKEVHHNRGDVLGNLKRHDEAANAYALWLKVNPQHPFTKGKFLHQKMLCCDWKDVDQLVAEIDKDLASGKPSAEPFGWQSVATSPRSLQICAELYAQNKFPENIKYFRSKPYGTSRKIRVGYSSGELRSQATSHLLAGVWELHDNSRFEIYGIDNGWDDQSEIRRRINAAVSRVIDISQLSESAAVAAILENEIDILVNLNGYFGLHRMEVFAHRPAPIQVNYLGFPGTLGASYIDYIIADQYVIPPDHKEFYTERVVYLPHCYQPNDRKRQIGSRVFTRVDCGLPHSGFVFCCFNNNYKITPDVFDCWMRILKQVDGSVVWLLEDNAHASTNLRKEAAIRGVHPERLVFAKRMSLPDHLARHRVADLFLDTVPCNAHTTASDALWAGLPVLTRVGETFPGRVGASLLNAIGLPELITSKPQTYECLAVNLATNPDKMALIKRKLADNLLTTPLFDTKLLTKHLEAAYAEMYNRHCAGLPPDHIYVSQ